MDNRLPSFVIIGAAKSGTTSLTHELRQLSGTAVFMPKMEPWFFNREWDRGLDWYRSLFAEAPSHAVLGEKTPQYLHDAEAMKRLAKTIPDAKLIVLVRDPVDRAVSHINHRINKGKLPTMDVLDVDYLQHEILDRPARYTAIVGQGFYTDHLANNVRPLFPASQVLVRATDGTARAIDRDRLQPSEHTPGQFVGEIVDEAYERLLGDVCRFIGVDPPPAGRPRRVSNVKNYPFTVTDDAAALLRSFYVGRNHGLSHVTGQTHVWG